MAKACAGLRVIRPQAMSLKAIASCDCFAPEFGIKSGNERRRDAVHFPLATLGMLIRPKMDTFVYSRALHPGQANIREKSLENCGGGHRYSAPRVRTGDAFCGDPKKLGRT